MHSLVHTREEPQKCKQCNFSCNTAGNLKRHIKKQTREKLHHCDQCEYKATDAVHEHRPLCEILFRMMTKTMLMISMTLMIMTMMVPRACHSVTVPQCHRSRAMSRAHRDTMDPKPCAGPAINHTHRTPLSLPLHKAR